MTSTDTTRTTPLADMRMADLKSLAQGLGLKGLSGKRKSDIVAMIEATGARSAGLVSGGRPDRAPRTESAPAVVTAPAPAAESSPAAAVAAFFAKRPPNFRAR